MIVFAEVSVKEVITLITLICGLLGAIGALIPTAVKAGKAMKELVKNKDWKQILKIADKAIESAEASGKAGADKKAMVIEAVKTACAEANIAIDEKQLENLGIYIDQMIQYFNNMTAAQKDITTDGK